MAMAGGPGLGGRFQLPPQERESFFAAQRRHRRVAFRYAVLGTIAVLFQAIPATVMLAPVLGALAVIATDLLNLVSPTPDLLAWIKPMIQDGSKAPQVWADRPWAGHDLPGLSALPPWAGLGLLAFGPGLLYMAVIWWWVLAVFLRQGLGGLIPQIGVRAPDRTDPEEHELLDVVEEMSLAAGIATPTVLVTDAEVDAAAFGAGSDRATLVVSRRILSRLDREQTQGVSGHLVASLANGDLRILNVILAVFITYALAPALLTPVLRQSRRQLWAVGKSLRRRDDAQQEALAVKALLAFDDDDAGFFASVLFLTWRVSNWVTNLFFVGPILVAPWRTRRYLADATAVQLTRDPDGLGRALEQLGAGAGGPAPAQARYASPYFLLEPSGSGTDDLGSDVGLFSNLHPSVARRLKRLRRLGYRGAGPQRRPLTAGRLLANTIGITLFAVLIVPLLALILVLALTLVETCVLLALFFSLLLVLIVVVPLHAVLRSLA